MERRLKMYLSIKQAAERLNVCTKTIHRRIADGSIPASRLSAKFIRIDEKDLEAFMTGKKG
jgi:excisionase family DNA binding protein